MLEAEGATLCTGVDPPHTLPPRFSLSLRQDFQLQKENTLHEFGERNEISGRISEDPSTTRERTARWAPDGGGTRQWGGTLTPAPPHLSNRSNKESRGKLESTMYRSLLGAAKAVLVQGNGWGSTPASTRRKTAKQQPKLLAEDVKKRRAERRSPGGRCYSCRACLQWPASVSAADLKPYPKTSICALRLLAHVTQGACSLLR